VLVALAGHPVPLLCEQANRLLNCFYDCTDWQLAEALPAAVGAVGDRFAPAALSAFEPAPGEGVLLLAACTVPGDKRVCAAPEVVVTAHAVARTRGVDAWESGAAAAPGGAPAPLRPRWGLWAAAVELGAFPQCGFYDWRFVVVGADGAPRPLPRAVAPAGVTTDAAAAAASLRSALLTSRAPGAAGGGGSAATLTLPAATLRPCASAATALTDAGAGARAGAGGGGGGFAAAGRVIVQAAGLARDKWHHSVIDYVPPKTQFGSEPDTSRGPRTFKDVAKALETLKLQRGVNAVYLCGAIDLDSGRCEVLRAGGGGSPSDGGGGGGGAASLDTARDIPLLPLVPLEQQLGGGSEATLSASGRGGGGGAREGGSFFSMGSFTSAGGSSGALSSPARGGGSGGGGFGAPPPPPQREPTTVFTKLPLNPLAVIDRRSANARMGGDEGFAALVQRAHAVGVGRVVVQFDAQVMARAHRRYAPLALRAVNPGSGLETRWHLASPGFSGAYRGAGGEPARGTSNNAGEAASTDHQKVATAPVMLNYRLVETWDAMVADGAALVSRFGLQGLYLTDAQSYPFTFELDPCVWK